MATSRTNRSTPRTSANARPALRTVTCGDFLDTPIPPRVEMLGTWLRERTLVMVYAAAGVGKSMLALSMALAVGGGGELIGWKSHRPRKVLIVDGEMDIADLQDRLNLLMQAISGGDADQTRGNVSLLAAQHQHPDATFPDLSEAEGREAVIQQVEATGAELVILDNLSTLATMEDENAASSFDPIIKLMQDLKLRGCATVLIHHAGKRGGYRGTSKIEAVFDAIIQLQHPGGVASHDGTAFDLRWEKYRGKRDESIRPMTVRLEAGEDGIAQWSAEASEDAQLSQLVAMVRSLDYPTQDALAASMDVGKGTISKWKGKAIEGEMIDAAEWSRCMAEAGRIATDIDPDY